MADLSQNARNSVALQREMFRLAEHEHGLSIAVLARTRGISVSTLKGWREGAAMPAWALGELDLPDDLTTLILTPFNKAVISTDADGEVEQTDFDTLGLDALGLAGEVATARSPASPGGVRIVHSEEAAIRDRVRPLVAKLRSVAA